MAKSKTPPEGAWCADCKTMYANGKPMCQCHVGRRRPMWGLAPERVRLAPKPGDYAALDLKAKRECVTVFCDASHDRHTKASAWAVWIKGPKGTFTQAYRFKRVPQTSAEAEKLAAANSLAVVRKLYEGARHITIVMQSDHISVGSVIKGDVSRNPGARDLNALLYGEAEKVRKLGWVIRFKHVKGHSGTGNPRSYVNDLLDNMARSLMRQVRSEMAQPALPLAV